MHCERVCYIIFSVSLSEILTVLAELQVQSAAPLPSLLSPDITGQCYTACYITLMSTSSCDPSKPGQEDWLGMKETSVLNGTNFLVRRVLSGELCQAEHDIHLA